MMREKLIREECGERLDDLQCDGLYLIQNPDKFCFGIDAVLLSNFVKVKKDCFMFTKIIDASLII